MITSSLDDIKNLKNHRVYKRFLFPFVGYTTQITLQPGVYTFECWGAQGTPFEDQNGHSPGFGAYTFGFIRIPQTKQFFVTVGQKGARNVSNPFGGGGTGDFPGGGASDIRIKNGTNFESLMSRIMVAAGGGGAEAYGPGGSGGALVGKNSSGGETTGATQTTPGTGLYHGSFGKGGGFLDNNDNNAGGGGGYYGGGSGKWETNGGGSGGSSYISGYPECNSIDLSSTDNQITHTGSPFHGSKIFFFEPFMADGDSEMPSPFHGTQTGNHGNGFVRIQLIYAPFQTVTQQNRLFHTFIFCSFVIFK